MAEYIDREALLHQLEMAIECKDCPRNADRKTYYDRCACSEIQDICDAITEAPKVDVQPVKRGEWEELRYNDYVNYYSAICSECGYESTDHYSIIDNHRYCEYSGGLKMTLDEAVTYFAEEAERRKRMSQLDGSFVTEARNKQEKRIHAEAAKNNRQLAEWLMELKDLRAEQNDQYVFIHELMSELKEAKRLLKLAVEDFETIESNLEYDEHCVIKTHSIRCDECPLSATTMSAATIYRCKWRHADEALKLIGDEPNGI